jgi:UDP-N-acetylglucosamine 2-epimerase (non-hydrolysing)
MGADRGGHRRRGPGTRRGGDDHALGRVLEETTFLRVPCLTLRPVTERPVTVTSGSNRLVRADELASTIQDALARGPYAGELPPLRDGASGPRIAGIIGGWLATRY